jgi:hypothetical protein
VVSVAIAVDDDGGDGEAVWRKVERMYTFAVIVLGAARGGHETLYSYSTYVYIRR